MSNQRARHQFRKTVFRVLDGSGRVALDTDDWVQAEACALRLPHRGPIARILGTHPTHTWAGERCNSCGGWDNGSYGSHAPCGFDFDGRSLVEVITELEATL